MDNHDKTDKESHDGNHGHGHGHSEDDDNIVLHQEKLLPTILMAIVFVVITMFGLAQAGNTKLDVNMGKSAYEQVKQSMPKIESNEHGKVEEKHEGTKAEEHTIEAPASESHTETQPEQNNEH